MTEKITDLKQYKELGKRSKAILKKFGMKFCPYCKNKMKPVVMDTTSIQLVDIEDQSTPVPGMLASCVGCGYSAFWNQKTLLGE